MTIEKVNLAEKFARFADHRSPKIVGDLNDSHIKLARLKGAFVWHRHEAEVEMFLVVVGTLTSTLRVVGYNSYQTPIQKVASSAMKARASLCHRTLGDKPPGQVSIAGAVVVDYVF